jgi:cytochrome c biogenesis protein CcmG, thiol:disulfide interchange protein DsbE
MSGRLVGALLAAGLLVGCGSPAPTTGPPSMPAAGKSVPSTRPSDESLGPAKRAAGIADCPRSDATVAPVRGGLPDVVLPCLGGGRDVRLAGLRGRPMMINIWAQWCEPCRAEARFLAEVASRPTGDLLIMGVDYSDPKPDWAIEFAELVGWKYPQVADQELAIRAPLQIAGPPQTLFVTPGGRIVHRHSGPFTSTQQITTLLREHLNVAA